MGRTFAAFLVGLFFGAAAMASITHNIKVGDAFPAAEVSALPLVGDGPVPGFGGGKLTIVVYWASWCPHCRAQTNYISDLYRKLGAQGVNIRVLGIDGDKDRAKGAAYAKEHIPFPSVLDEGQKLYDKWGVQGIPVTFVVNGDGKIQEIVPGESMYPGNPITAAIRASINQ